MGRHGGLPHQLAAFGRQLGEDLRFAPSHHDAGRQHAEQLLQVARA